MKKHFVVFLLLAGLNHVYATKAPQIKEISTELETVDGRDISFICKTAGVPQPKIMWTHNGKTPLPGRHIVLKTGSLHISNVQFEDSGEYNCYAENEFGNASRSFNFTVRKHTEIINDLERLEVTAGSNVSFHCKVNHDKNLNLEVSWLHNGKVIDHDREPRFIKTSDYSLIITKTAKKDSGIYTCYAETALDETVTSGGLIVEDVPEPPQMGKIVCDDQNAIISWMHMSDSKPSILYYVIQYALSSAPNSWKIIYDRIPFNDTSCKVQMSPWTNYTFRILAVNRIGHSLPSLQSETCKTKPDVPYKNPDNIKAERNGQNRLVISWDPMPLIEHNGPRFRYKVCWKEDKSGAKYQMENIFNWQQHQIVIQDILPFARYRIKVLASNEIGIANVVPEDVVVYSNENLRKLKYY